jgi:hypothetical protein
MTTTSVHDLNFPTATEGLPACVPTEIVELQDGDTYELRIAPVEPVDKFANMVFRPDVINGDPADLVHIQWEYNVDLP